MDKIYVMHLGFLLIALSFAVRNFIILRILSILASVLMIIHGFIEQKPWTDPITLWNILFIITHLVQLSYTYFINHITKFNEEETQLFQTVFPALTPLKFAKLLRAGEWEKGLTGMLLTQEGIPVKKLLLISRGHAEVLIDERRVAELQGGSFVGEMSFILNSEASATVRLTCPTTFLFWERSSLETLFEKNPAIQVAMSQVMNKDIVEKLIQSNRV